MYIKKYNKKFTYLLTIKLYNILICIYIDNQLLIIYIIFSLLSLCNLENSLMIIANLPCT